MLIERTHIPETLQCERQGVVDPCLCSAGIHLSQWWPTVGEACVSCPRVPLTGSLLLENPYHSDISPIAFSTHSELHAWDRPMLA